MMIKIPTVRPWVIAEVGITTGNRNISVLNSAFAKRYRQGAASVTQLQVHGQWVGIFSKCLIYKPNTYKLITNKENVATALAMQQVLLCILIGQSTADTCF